MTTDETQKKPVRKTPIVRKPMVITDSSVVPAKKLKKSGSVEGTKEKVKMSQNSKTILLMIASFLVGTVLTYSVTTSPGNAQKTSSSTFTELIAGKVALTESELIDAVKQLGVDVYWAGPVSGAKYTLAVPAEGQAYVRYLPNGDGLTDTQPNYVVIATYTTPAPSARAKDNS